MNVDTFLGDKFAMMTYAYIRRNNAAILYLQGHFDSGEFNHIQDIFKRYQILTSPDYRFQEDAADSALKFMREYSHWFTKRKITSAVSTVLTGKVIDKKSFGFIMSDVEVMNMIDSTPNYE